MHKKQEQCLLFFVLGTPHFKHPTLWVNPSFE